MDALQKAEQDLQTLAERHGKELKPVKSKDKFLDMREKEHEQEREQTDYYNYHNPIN